MFVRKLFYASAALFLLAAAYHLGATNASAQKASTPEVAAAFWSNTTTVPTFGAIPGNIVVMTNGDLYFHNGAYAAGWQKLGNAVTP